MQYLNKATLKAILYMLHNDNKLELSFFNTSRNKNIITDINSYELQDNFNFKINKEYVDNNINKIKKIYNDISSEDSNISAISLREITKILIENPTDIELIDLINISATPQYPFINKALILILEVSKKEKLITFINEYISNFENNSLTAQKHNYYSFEKNLFEIKKILDSFQNKYGKRFIFQLPLNENVRYGIYNKELRLIEILFYLLNKGYINIEGTKISKIKYKTSKEEYILNISITLKKSLPEITDTKNVVTIPKVTPEVKNLENEVAFKLSYDEDSCEIFINDKKLSHPQQDSINNIVFKYLYKHANQDVKREELCKEVNDKLYIQFTKPINKIANELGFTGDRKKLFFITGKITAKLRTEITKKKLLEAKIDPSKILPH
jgi:hypothetical protein